MRGIFIYKSTIQDLFENKYEVHTDDLIPSIPRQPDNQVGWKLINTHIVEDGKKIICYWELERQ